LFDLQYFKYEEGSSTLSAIIWNFWDWSGVFTW